MTMHQCQTFIIRLCLTLITLLKINDIFVYFQSSIAQWIQCNLFSPKCTDKLYWSLSKSTNEESFSLIYIGSIKHDMYDACFKFKTSDIYSVSTNHNHRHVFDTSFFLIVLMCYDLCSVFWTLYSRSFEL